MKFYHDVETEVIEKSGNPGYEIGKPIKGLYSDPKIWATHQSSLCRFTPTTSMLFLKNSISACFLQLSRDNFTKCQDLREGLRDLHFEAISTYNVSKGGDEDEYVPVIFEDFTRHLINDSDVQECTVPSRVHVEIMYTNNSGEFV